MSISDKDEEPAGAPRYNVPTERIVSVEHPCIVKNVDKAIDMLGGGKPISDTLDHASEKSLSLKFTPNGQSIMSMNNKTNSVLLKITVPKRIGKRKRGSDRAMTPIKPDEMVGDAQQILRSIQDNQQSTALSALGTIENGHIFRSIPDFAYSTADSRFRTEIQSKLMGRELNAIKSFRLPQTYGVEDIELFPPPVLSSASYPQTYSYLDKQPNKLYIPAPSEDPLTAGAVDDVDPTWPSTPSPSLPNLADQPQRTRDFVARLSEMFEQRPLWTRRALINSLPPQANITQLRLTLPYVAFYIRSGPWRDTLCRLGVDPRTSPDFAKYQTIQPKIGTKILRQFGWARSTNPTGHLYTGQESVDDFDTRLFQLCDISEPQLAQLIDISAPAPSSSSSPSAPQTNAPSLNPALQGWIPNGRLTKIKVLFRAKVHATSTGPARSAEEFSHFLTLPDHYDCSKPAGVVTHPDKDLATANDPASLLPPLFADDFTNRLAEEYHRMLRRSGNRTKNAVKRAKFAADDDDDDDNDNDNANDDDGDGDDAHDGDGGGGGGGGGVDGGVDGVDNTTNQPTESRDTK